MIDLYAVSPAFEYEDELNWALRLLDAGLKRYHFRKPNWSAERCALWLRAVPRAYRRQISIHQHYTQVEDFELGGLHRPDRACAAWPIADSSHLPWLFSRSLHALSALDEVADSVDYVFLSPVFTSISKVNYGPTWTESDLKQALAQPRHFALIALGGMAAPTVGRAMALGFDALALHGCLWAEGQDPLQALLSVQRAGELAK